MNISQKQDAITRIDLDGFGSGWNKWILFLSDIHLDSLYCDLPLLTSHLNEAKEKDAMILIAGDLWDGMQGRNDPRRSARELKETLKGLDYFDRILDEAVEFFRPYAHNLAMLGYGNHEYSVVMHNGTDLPQRFAAIMRQLGSPIVIGGYGGFIRLGLFTGSQATPRRSFRIYYNHGAGSEAPVTKGMIQTARQAAYIRGVDVVWNGHNHQEYISHQSTLEINNKDAVEQGMVTYIRTPGYKNEYGDAKHGFNGFAASRMMQPTPRGCAWGELKQHSHDVRSRFFADVI